MAEAIWGEMPESKTMPAVGYSVVPMNEWLERLRAEMGARAAVMRPIQRWRYRLMTVEIGGYTFQGWYTYTSALTDAAGLYAIGPTPLSALKKDENLKLIDVGESNNIRERVKNHDRKACWRSRARAIRYAYLRTPGKSKSEREEIEKDIRDKEDPPCGKE